jgi:hypothetical protein
MGQNALARMDNALTLVNDIDRLTRRMMRRVRRNATLCRKQTDQHDDQVRRWLITTIVSDTEIWSGRRSPAASATTPFDPVSRNQLLSGRMTSI